MAKVYLVMTNEPCESPYFHGVYSTLDKADKVWSSLKGQHWALCVFEVELDEEKDFSSSWVEVTGKVLIRGRNG